MNFVVAPPQVLVENIKQYKLENGFSDEKMAELLSCSRATYSNTVNSKIPVGDTFFSGAVRLLSSQDTVQRTASVNRETSETSIRLELNIDGTGKYDIYTGVNMFDHLLSQLAKHGLFDITLKADGDDPHHIVEDVAICLGKAFGEALAEKRGLVRMADVTVPMDEALVQVAVDISGRGYAVLDFAFTGNDMFGFSADLVRHFFESFAFESRVNLHARVLYGSNDHHKAEALFKALGKALDKATIIDERISRELPTTKGRLES
jgi:imidazoleglycerol-phosphate dehydratase